MAERLAVFARRVREQFDQPFPIHLAAIQTVQSDGAGGERIRRILQQQQYHTARIPACANRTGTQVFGDLSRRHRHDDHRIEAGRNKLDPGRFVLSQTMLVRRRPRAIRSQRAF